MNRELRISLGLAGVSLYAAAFCYFYYVYVPLIVPFQLVLAPLLLFTLVATLVRPEWGLFWFVLAFPLINSLPYFFGIDERTPHAPVALVLFLVFLGGWLARKAASGTRLAVPAPIRRPAALFSAVVLVSALVTFWRYTGYVPFVGGTFDRIVNVNQVQAGGAVMSDIFNSLNYLTGLALFLIILDSVRTREMARRLLTMLGVSMSLALLFSLVQKFISARLGNQQVWVALGQLNSTLKDPNAFGAFVSAGVPLFLGLALASRKGARAAFLVPLSLSVFILPSIGTRSSVLAVFISLVFFGGLSLSAAGPRSRRRLAYLMGGAILFAVIGLSVSTFLGRATLAHRLAASFDHLVNQGDVNAALDGKQTVWTVAVRMIEDFPLSGVGMGAYIIELPNYLHSLRRPFTNTDSAENLFLQAGAELGLIGLGLLIWILLALAGRMRRAWREAEGVGDKFISAGVCAALLSLGVNLAFHSYIGSFDVMYAFWLLAGIGWAGAPEAGPGAQESPRGSLRRRAPLLLLGVFALSHLWNSGRSLSLDAEIAAHGWKQRFGLYETEMGEKGLAFRWTRKSAGLTVENSGPVMVIPLMASHPDLERKPVKVRVYLADRSLRKRALLREIVLTSSEWRNIEYVPPDGQADSYLVFCVDRDWRPSKLLGTGDVRSLGLALGEIWFRYPARPGDEKLRILRTVPADGWTGGSGGFLFTNGSSEIEFSTQRPDLALRLWVRGSKALGIGPMITIRLDGRIICKTLIEADDWSPLIVRRGVGPGDHILGVEYTNDLEVRGTSEDRNLRLGDLDILGQD